MERVFREEKGKKEEELIIDFPRFACIYIYYIKPSMWMHRRVHRTLFATGETCPAVTVSATIKAIDNT